MENKKTYSLGRFEDGVAATIFVIVSLCAGVAVPFVSAVNALKQKAQKTR